MRLYLDLCCYNRPFDDRTQARVDAEAVAVEAILEGVRQGADELWDSSVLEWENRRTPSAYRRAQVKQLRRLAQKRARAGRRERARAAELEDLGYDSLDAAHLSVAAFAGVGVFLTTDDLLLSRWRRLGEPRSLAVMNPIDYLERAVE